MPSNIPPKRVNKYCKVCFEKTEKRYFMENLGNKIRCPNCGRTVPIANTRPLSSHLRSVDPVRFRTAGFGIGGARGSGQDKLDTWETPTPMRRSGRRTPRQSVGRFPIKPDFDSPYDNEKEYRIIGILPYIKNLEDVSCEVISGTLVVESLIEGFEFLQKFSLPEDILTPSLKVALKNGILEIHFKKRKRTSK